MSVTCLMNQNERKKSRKGNRTQRRKVSSFSGGASESKSGKDPPSGGSVGTRKTG